MGACRSTQIVPAPKEQNNALSLIVTPPYLESPTIRYSETKVTSPSSSKYNDEKDIYTLIRQVKPSNFKTFLSGLKCPAIVKTFRDNIFTIDIALSHKQIMMSKEQSYVFLTLDVIPITWPMHKDKSVKLSKRCHKLLRQWEYQLYVCLIIENRRGHFLCHLYRDEGMDLNIMTALETLPDEV